MTGTEADFEEMADLARFTDHAPLRRACLSHLRCEVLEIAS